MSLRELLTPDDQWGLRAWVTLRRLVAGRPADHGLDATLTAWQPEWPSLDGMRRIFSRRRSGTAVKLYLGLFAVGVLMYAAVAHDYIAELFRHGDTVEIVSPMRKMEPPHYGPSINWGGAARQ
jgi:hypothetical protein